MTVKPMLGDWEIPRISSIRALEQRAFVELAVPGRVGSLFQDLNTSATRIAIRGSLHGTEARDEFLETLREKFRAGEPVTFVADIVTATEVQYVVIEHLHVQEQGERPDELEYLVVLHESPPPPPPPDPLGGLDADLLDQAGNLLDTVTGALDVIDGLGNIPDLGNPVPRLQSSLDGFEGAATGVAGALDGVRALFGLPT